MLDRATSISRRASDEDVLLKQGHVRIDHRLKVALLSFSAGNLSHEAGADDRRDALRIDEQVVPKWRGDNEQFNEFLHGNSPLVCGADWPTRLNGTSGSGAAAYRGEGTILCRIGDSEEP